MNATAAPGDAGVSAPAAGGGFATTHWTLVAGAAEANEAQRRAALEELCRLYWMPLRRFAERSGASCHDAEDLTQSFFADLLARGAIARADPTRGRFRTFLLAAFKHHVAHEFAKARRQKRGGDRELVALDALGAGVGGAAELADAPEDDRCFDREWALALLDRALGALREEYAAAGKVALFGAIKDALWSGRGGTDYATVAAKMGMTPGALQVAVHRLRRRFAEQLRAEVARTVLAPAEIDGELRHLLAAVAQ